MNMLKIKKNCKREQNNNCWRCWFSRYWQLVEHDYDIKISYNIYVNSKILAYRIKDWTLQVLICIFFLYVADS